MSIARSAEDRRHTHSGKYPRPKFPAPTGQLAQITRSTLVTWALQGCNCKCESNAGIWRTKLVRKKLHVHQSAAEEGREKDLPSQCAILCTIEKSISEASLNGLVYPLFSINLQYNETQRSAWHVRVAEGRFLLVYTDYKSEGSGTRNELSLRYFVSPHDLQVWKSLLIPSAAR
jgi:hypothetical protein